MPPGITTEQLHSIDDVVEAIKKYRGVASKAYKSLNMSCQGFYDYMDRHPEVKVALDKARKGYAEDCLDLAESAIVRCMQSEDLGRAESAAKYYLNNKGKERGYNHPEASQTKISTADLLEACRSGKLKQEWEHNV